MTKNLSHVQLKLTYFGAPTLLPSLTQDSQRFNAVVLQQCQYHVQFL